MKGVRRVSLDGDEATDMETGQKEIFSVDTYEVIVEGNK